MREAQALRATAANSADAQGAAESSPLRGGLQGIESQAQSNLAFIRNQGDLNRATAKADNLAFVGSLFGAGANFFGGVSDVAGSKEGQRTLSNIFGT